MEGVPDYTWKELAEKFAELKDAMRHSRIDVQWGDVNERVTLKGAMNGRGKKKFRIISALAATKVDSIKDDLSIDEKRVSSFSKPYKKWMAILWELSDGFESSDHYGQMIDENENVTGHLFLGHIRDPAAASERLCMKFSQFEKPEKPLLLKSFWEEHGKQIINVAIGGFVGSLLTLLAIWIFG